MNRKEKQMLIIDIEMPECCANCPCFGGLPHLWACNVTGIYVEDAKYRPVWCPLRRVQE